MNKDILVSVITVAYNSSKYIRETIESVLEQDYKNFEYIIIDDCSIDNTWNIIDEYRDACIKSYRNETNLGEYANRNKGIRLATGKYLIFIDGDDVMYPHALTIFLSYAEKFPECAVLIAKNWAYWIKCPYKVSPADFFRFEYFDKSILDNFSKLLFKTAILKAEPFPQNLRLGDSYILLKICQTNPAVIIPDGLTWWRRRSGNATSQLLANSKHYAEKTKFYLELLNENCPLSVKEIEEAKINVYGIYLRLLFWQFAKGKFSEVIFLQRQIKVPLNYLHSFFIPRKSGVFKDATGDNPLHTPR